MGGPSSEHDVSMRSGVAVARGLAETGYNVCSIEVKGPDFVIPQDVEAVFVALHGMFGEDGQIQSILEQRQIPYTGSDPDASRRSFDKVESKQVFVDNGIPTPAYEILRNGQHRSLELPVVVKPARQGSSIGVNRVFQEGDWSAALKNSLIYGDELIVESYVKGRELTVGVVSKDVLPIIEIVAPGDWYGYDEKYTKGASQYLVPAPLDESVVVHCGEMALRTFKALGCSGLGRVDFRLSEDGKIYVLELNNIPGFTETSLLPKAAAEAGIDFPSLCGRIMETASLAGGKFVLNG